MLNPQEYFKVFQGCNYSISILAGLSPTLLQRGAKEADGHKALLPTTPSPCYGTRCFQIGLCISLHGHVLSFSVLETPDPLLLMRDRGFEQFYPVLALILPLCFQLFPPFPEYRRFAAIKTCKTCWTSKMTSRKTLPA